MYKMYALKKNTHWLNSECFFFLNVTLARNSVAPWRWS